MCNQIIVRGRVQNVGFRYFILKTANMYGVKGFVRNEYDGSVYIRAEAAKPDMDAFIRTLRQGPSWARIDQVDITQLPCGDFDGFSIR